MNNLSNFQYPPPKHWQDFESLCRDLWTEIWKDPNTQKNGRSGQSQQGVDVFGQPDQKNKWAGVQCKGKDNYSNKNVTEEELTDEVKKAKNFSPTLSSWILATTAPRDATIQQKAREINEDHKKNGLFSVHVWSWEDIVDELVKYPLLMTKHFPQISNLDPALNQKIEATDTRTQSIEAKVSEGIESILTELKGIQTVERQEILTTEYDAEIDDIRVLITEHQYKDAIKAYERLRNRIWVNASGKVKFRILTNLGNAYYQWGKLEEAGPLFIEAYQYNPDDEISLTNLSIAYSFQGEFKKTEEYAQRILEKNPANINGYCILLQIPPYRNSFDKALEFVPITYRKTSLIAFCLGLSAQYEKRFDIALEWFETALKNDTENNPDFKANVAIMLMQSIWSEQSPLLYGQISENDKQILERVIKLLTEAWDQIRNTDLREVHPNWLLNLGIAKKLIGKIDEANEDIKSAHDLKPLDPEFNKHLALIILRKSDSKGADEILDKIRGNKDVPEISSILADIYNSEGQPEKALIVINDFLKWNKDEHWFFLSFRILVDIYLNQNDLENASIYSQKLLQEFPNLVSTYVSAARVSRSKSNTQEATEFLLKGKDLISTNTHLPDLVELADEFYNLQMFRESAECYEIFTDIEQNTKFTIRLLFSYYNAGILSKALNLCRTIRNKCGILFKHTEIEIGILEETNNFTDAKELAIQYLENFPDNLSVKLRLGRLNYLLGDFSGLERILSETLDISSVSLNDGLIISSFLAQVNRVKDSFDLMYELRRKFFQEGESHSFYIANFFAKDKEASQFLYSESVKVGFAVCIKRIDGNKEWYIIEDRPDADLQKREFHISHPRVQDFLGKKVGDKILIKKSANNEEIAEIVEIKSKYVYALHDTMQVYETMFPERNDFWTIHVTKSDDGGADFEKIRNITASRSKRASEVMNLYQTTGLTVGVIAELLGLTAHEAWESLLTTPNKLTFCSSGNPSVLDDTVSILSIEKPPKLVADITSIYLARLLKIEDKIVAHFGKLLVAPSTIFSLTRKLEEIKKNRNVGLLSIAERDGILYKNEVTPEEVEKYIVYLEDLIEWIRNNCEITPHQIGFDIERNQKSKMREALLPEFFDTTLIVKDENYLLFSEDERLSQIAKSTLGIQRTWIQPVLITLKIKGIISSDDYNEAILKLITTNLEHIHFDDYILLESARKSDWTSKPHYLQAVRRLQGKRAEIQSATNVAAMFLFQLDMILLAPQKKMALISQLLGNLTYERNLQETLNLLREKILRVTFFPLAQNRILSSIDFWEKYKLVLA